MSTRSLIGQEDQEGRVRYIYCHHDGYLSHNGKILHNHYRTQRRVNQLLALGYLDALGPVISRWPQTQFNTEVPVHRRTCILLDDPLAQQEVTDRDRFRSISCGAVFWYLWTPERVWFYSHYPHPGWDLLEHGLV